jgi:hippurate hydrolase
VSHASEVAGLQDELVELRRSLHEDPEVGLHLPRTQAKVLAALGNLPLEITLGRQTSSITAVLRGDLPGPAVLLRGDMDALPIVENTSEPFSSKTEGAMHACGHDIHTTMLVGAAKLLAARRSEIRGSVVFMFQPGEEGWDGAQYMIDEGVLDAAGQRAIAAYAVHVFAMAGVTPGAFTTRRGAMYASSDRFEIVMRGTGGAGALPHLSLDPIPASAELILALQTIVSREVDFADPAVLSIGKINGGEAFNVIPDSVTIGGTFRTFSPKNHARITRRLQEIGEGIAAAHGLTMSLSWGPSYPVTMNEPSEAEFVHDTVTDLLGQDRFEWAESPNGAAEDFSKVLQQVPGAAIMVGARKPDAEGGSHHTPTAEFDEWFMSDGAAVMAELAIRRLAAGSEA